MSLTESDVRHIAGLARLHVADEDLGQLREELERILEFVAQMDTVDTTGIEPMAHPLDAVQRLRADEITEADRREAFQAAAPSVSEGLYLVPRVVE